MSKKLIISEEEKKRIIKLYEQITGGDTNASPDKLTSELVGKTKTLRGGLFITGSDKINVDSEEFKQAVEDLSKASSANIVGGASSVGSDRGYDNEGLALRRASNFLNALKSAGVDTSRMEIDTKVGDATKRNSPEALKQQFVSYTITELSSKTDYISAIDNTATVNPKIQQYNQNKVVTTPDPPKPKKSGNEQFIDVRFFYNSSNDYQKNVSRGIKIMDLLKKGLDSNSAELKKVGFIRTQGL